LVATTDDTGNLGRTVFKSSRHAWGHRTRWRQLGVGEDVTPLASKILGAYLSHGRTSGCSMFGQVPQWTWLAWTGEPALESCTEGVADTHTTRWTTVDGGHRDEGFRMMEIWEI
jgi:hypothetical protein